MPKCSGAGAAGPGQQNAGGRTLESVVVVVEMEMENKWRRRRRWWLAVGVWGGGHLGGVPYLAAPKIAVVPVDEAVVGAHAQEKLLVVVELGGRRSAPRRIEDVGLVGAK